MKPEELWKKARCPTTEELQGDYRVMALGFFSWLNILADHKRIIGLGGKNFTSFWEGGYFTLVYGKDHYVLDYNHGDNPEWLRDVVDHVRIYRDEKTDTRQIIGKFYKGGVFRFWFEMVRP